MPFEPRMMWNRSRRGGGGVASEFLDLPWSWSCVAGNQYVVMSPLACDIQQHALQPSPKSSCEDARRGKKRTHMLQLALVAQRHFVYPGARADSRALHFRGKPRVENLDLCGPTTHGHDRPEIRRVADRKSQTYLA